MILSAIGAKRIASARSDLAVGERMLVEAAPTTWTVVGLRGTRPLSHERDGGPFFPTGAGRRMRRWRRRRQRSPSARVRRGPPARPRGRGGRPAGGGTPARISLGGPRDRPLALRRDARATALRPAGAHAEHV